MKKSAKTTSKSPSTWSNKGKGLTIENVTLLSNDTKSSRDLITWINTEVAIGMKTIKELNNGAIYCLLLHKIFPQAIPIRKVFFNTIVAFEIDSNFRLLHRAFARLGVNRDIPHTELIRGLGHYKFVIWFHKFYMANKKTQLDAVHQSNQDETQKLKRSSSTILHKPEPRPRSASVRMRSQSLVNRPEIRTLNTPVVMVPYDDEARAGAGTIAAIEAVADTGAGAEVGTAVGSVDGTPVESAAETAAGAGDEAGAGTSAGAAAGAVDEAGAGAGAGAAAGAGDEAGAGAASGAAAGAGAGAAAEAGDEAGAGVGAGAASGAGDEAGAAAAAAGAGDEAEAGARSLPSDTNAGSQGVMVPFVSFIPRLIVPGIRPLPSYPGPKIPLETFEIMQRAAIMANAPKPSRGPPPTAAEIRAKMNGTQIPLILESLKEQDAHEKWKKENMQRILKICVRKQQISNENAPKQENESQNESSKQEMSNENVPQQEALKEEVRKQEVLKEDVLKQDALNEDVPKQEPLMKEVPKQEDLKKDYPKQEALKEDAPKQEALKVDILKKDISNEESSKKDVTKLETSEISTSNQEISYISNQDISNEGAPSKDTSEIDALNREASKEEASKQMALKKDTSNREALKEDAVMLKTSQNAAAEKEISNGNLSNQDNLNKITPSKGATEIDATSQEVSKEKTSKQETLNKNAAEHKEFNKHGSKQDVSEDDVSKQKTSKKNTSKQEASKSIGGTRQVVVSANPKAQDLTFFVAKLTRESSPSLSSDDDCDSIIILKSQNRTLEKLIDRVRRIATDSSLDYNKALRKIRKILKVHYESKFEYTG